jgi:secreted PhoX family phosphatase
MKGIQHPTNDETINPSGNESIRDVLERTDVGRRRFIKTAAGASALAAFGGVSLTGIVGSVEAAPLPAGNGFAGIGFDSVPASLFPVADQVAVPAGYKVEVLAAWGDPVVPGAPDWAEDATQDAAAQALQFGMHNDGMHYFPFGSQGAGRGVNPVRGLLCVNHEYTHEEILHGAEGLNPVSVAKVRKSQAAHGVSVVEVRRNGGQWIVARNSPWNRRITGNSPMRVSGAAAGHPLMRSKRFAIGPAGSAEQGVNDGFTAFGTLNNCAHGYTPWGTYLTCEENWNGYFAAPTQGAVIDDLNNQKPEIIAGQFRYGVSTTGSGGYKWHDVDPRFNADTNPLEPHLFGWVVEIDPFDRDSRPVKRTALGRMKHESAQVAVSPDAQGTPNRVAFYMGDDERNEYIYKFVCARAFDPNDRRANRDLLDEGVLYVAKFSSTPGQRTGSFRGQWIALVPETPVVASLQTVPGQTLRLRDLPAFSGANDTEVQALILIKTRQAADAVGATMMDRPEWTALRTYYDAGRAAQGYSSYGAQRPLEVYCTLTNNNRRGGGGSSGATSTNNPDGTTMGGTARPPVDVANPRPDNDYGHIIRWREDGNVVTASAFEWDIFMLCGDSVTTKTLPNTATAKYQDANLVDGVAGAGPDYEGNIVDVPAGTADFGAPDGLWFDQFGRLWVQTDQQGDAQGDWVNIGANVMACADPNTKQVRRFMTSPPNCEVTGVVNTPDGTTMFVGIQHPGEDSPATNPDLYSNWPQSQFATNSTGDPLPNTPGVSRPRSSVLVITRFDGGVIGA